MGDKLKEKNKGNEKKSVRNEKMLETDLHFHLQKLIINADYFNVVIHLSEKRQRIIIREKENGGVLSSNKLSTSE